MGRVKAAPKKLPAPKKPAKIKAAASSGGGGKELPPPPAATRPYKFKQGTIALREIRKQQQQTEPTIPKLAFSRLVREIDQNEHSHSGGMRWTPGAFKAMQVAAEEHLIDVFDKAETFSVGRGLSTLQKIDMEMAHFMVTGNPKFRPTVTVPFNTMKQARDAAAALEGDPTDVSSLVAPDDEGDDDYDERDASEGESEEEDYETGSHEQEEDDDDVQIVEDQPAKKRKVANARKTPAKK